MPPCRSCRLEADVDALPVWERAYLDGDWRLAHASASLAGYMVLSPRRHVVSLDELTAREAAALGPLLAATTGALRAVVGCSKTYVMLFAEKRGWAHVHFHVVPRMPDFGEDQIGPGALDFVNRPEAEWVPPEERARVAADVGARVRAHVREIS
ncbi:MAG: HIT family protein [Actinomycetota bacterium]|nr:HIT family protein [Actinomycetota bacterium]